ncbi:MAG: SsrA-binding protein SmpB [Oscillospiraceae bacterium]|nr:SsrA-binding protein SmpB [Oscillospiraceae bacterium]MCR5166550.1 SsrA-binding protein SmpB [Oscillospiraceae bacterium]
MSEADKKTQLKTIAENRKARHDYFILESFEAGIELVGTEVKSIRKGSVNLKDSWCSIDNGELFVRGMHIAPYEQGNIFNREPMRTRRLLLHKREIMRLYGTLKQEGLTLVPISLYFKGSRVKMQVGLCKGKKIYDKRDDMAARAAKRDIDRAVKNYDR